MKPNILLASSSIHRMKLLDQVGLDYRALPAPVNERELEKNFSGTVEELSSFLALKKAQAVQNLNPEDIVIGCDQVLIFKGKALHKPHTKKEVIRRLKQLQGDKHQLSTGLCVLYKKQSLLEVVDAHLVMHPLSDAEILRYIELDQPMGCAGGYKIEQNGPRLFSAIQTRDHHSIIGLPLLKLLSILRENFDFYI